MNTQEVEKKFIGQIPLASVFESKRNPRQSFDGIEDLAASIKAKGVISPILVRDIGDKQYELVYGARRVRAAGQAGLKEIPAFLTECSDEEAQELRIIENAQRADVHPLHEAQAMQRLLDKGKAVTIEVVAGRLGRTPGYIRRRLELLGLPKEAQESLLKGEMVLGVAQLIAGLPQATARERAWKALEDSADYTANLTDVATAREEIRRVVLPDLEEAPFKLDQELAGVVACIRCPSRTSAQSDLFGEAKGAGNCLEPKCYQTKVAAAYDAAAAAMKASGKGTILTAKESKELFPYGDRVSGGYIEANGKIWSGDREVSVASIMKGQDEKVLLAKSPAGVPVLVYPRRSVEALIKKTKSGASPQKKAANAKARREDELEEFVDDYVANRMRAEALNLGAVEFLTLIGMEIVRADTDNLESEPFKNSAVAQAFARHDVPDLKAFKASIETVKQRIYRDVIFDRHVETGTQFVSNEEIEPVLSILGLNLKSLRKDAEKAFAQAEKAQTEAKPAAEASKPKKGRRK